MKKRGDKFPNLIGVTFAEIARVIQTLWLLYQILDLGSQIHFRGRRSMFSNSQGLSLIGSKLEQYLNQFQRKSLKLLETILLQAPEMYLICKKVLYYFQSFTDLQCKCQSKEHPFQVFSLQAHFFISFKLIDTSPGLRLDRLKYVFPIARDCLLIDMICTVNQ